MVSCSFICVVDDKEVNELLPEDDTPTSDSNAVKGLTPDSGDSDDFWKSFITSTSTPKTSVQDSNSLLRQEQHVSELNVDSYESSDGSETPGSQPNSPKKRNKWKPEEVKKFIQLRGELHGRFQAGKGRMALWKEISKDLMNEGFNRSPGQCKSLWTSLLQKYEVCSSPFGIC